MKKGSSAGSFSPVSTHVPMMSAASAYKNPKLSTRFRMDKETLVAEDGFDSTSGGAGRSLKEQVPSAAQFTIQTNL